MNYYSFQEVIPYYKVLSYQRPGLHLKNRVLQKKFAGKWVVEMVQILYAKPIYDLAVSKNRGTPKWMVKIRKNPIRIDDLVVPLFLETPIWVCCLCDHGSIAGGRGNCTRLESFSVWRFFFGGGFNSTSQSCLSGGA